MLQLSFKPILLNALNYIGRKLNITIFIPCSHYILCNLVHELLFFINDARHRRFSMNLAQRCAMIWDFSLFSDWRAVSFALISCNCALPYRNDNTFIFAYENDNEALMHYEHHTFVRNDNKFYSLNHRIIKSKIV